MICLDKLLHAPEPRPELIDLLKGVEGTLRTHCAHERHLNQIPLSASWTSLSRLVRQRPTEQRWLKSPAEALEPLIQHAVRAAVSRKSDARELANIAYGAVSTLAILRQADAPLSTALAMEAERRVGDCKP